MLVKPDGVFDVNVIDQHSAIIISFHFFSVCLFYCCYKLSYTSIATGLSGLSQNHKIIELGTENVKRKI